MAIKSYNSKADYDAAVKPTTESQVSMIETTREIIVDGVMSSLHSLPLAT